MAKNNVDKLPKWFSVMLVPRLLLPPEKIRIFGPKTAKFGPKYAFLVILGQILAFLLFLSNARPKNDANKVPRWVTKLLISQVKIKILCPKPPNLVRIGIFVHFGPGLAGSFGALLVVGWWLWRAGCISQDTYYFINNNMTSTQFS